MHMHWHVFVEWVKCCLWYYILATKVWGLLCMDTSRHFTQIRSLSRLTLSPIIRHSQQGPQNLVPTLYWYFHLLSDLLTPDAPGSKSLQESLEALLHHFKLKRVVNALRFHNELTTMPVHANSRSQHAMHVESHCSCLPIKEQQVLKANPARLWEAAPCSSI